MNREDIKTLLSYLLEIAARELDDHDFLGLCDDVWLNMPRGSREMFIRDRLGIVPTDVLEKAVKHRKEAGEDAGVR